MLSLIILVFTYSASHEKGLCVSTCKGTIDRVWPLDRFVCTSEVLNNKWTQTDSCSYLFGLPSTQFSDETMLFTGTNYVDLNVDFTTTSHDPYTFGAFIYQNMSSGAILQYQSIPHGTKSILLIENGVLKISRTTISNQESISGSTEIPANTWTYVAFSVSQNGALSIYINTNLEMSTSGGVRREPEVPGSLRIGGVDQQNDGFTGQIACVSFTYNETQPDHREAERICGSYRGNSTAYLAEPMSVTGMCSVLLTSWMLQSFHII